MRRKNNCGKSLVVLQKGLQSQKPHGVDLPLIEPIRKEPDKENAEIKELTEKKINGSIKI